MSRVRWSSLVFATRSPLGLILASLLCVACLFSGCQIDQRCETDEDGDGAHGDPEALDCSTLLDCDDNDADIYPGADEVADGKDNNCDRVLLPAETDDDGDGTSEYEGDCDDADADRAPGRTEQCDGIDNDCDGVVPADEGDADGDGFRVCSFEECDDSAKTVNRMAPEICDGLDNDCDGAADEDFDQDHDGAFACPGSIDDDCNDRDGDVRPGVADRCNDRDDDCDGLIDEDAADGDGDGYLACGPVADCDDQDATVYPGAPERCDGQLNDCDGGSIPDDEADLDRDGYVVCSTGQTSATLLGGEDCDDTRAFIYPGAPEQCNGHNDDCDAQTDEGPDQDGDGHSVCLGDCDDDNDQIYPGAYEACNGADDDCDGLVPPNEIDSDGDGFVRCTPPVQTPAWQGGDCNDNDGAIKPGAPELCDGLDNNCSGDIDANFEEDNDGDGFAECEGDVDDSDPAVNPDANERCDGVDNNGDGLVDGLDTDGDGLIDQPAEPTTALYRDGDADGYGVSGAPLVLCIPGSSSAPTGYVTQRGDCDDSDATINPGVVEVCEAAGSAPRDNDCDGSTDEGLDADGDGFSACGDDCDDSNATINPDADELCTAVDEDCDGDGASGAVDTTTYYLDGDGDGYGDTTVAVNACSAPDGYVLEGGDCDDANSAAHPRALEICDEIDNNCDGQSDEELDEDGDGYLACGPAAGRDCDDDDAASYPGAPEFCDGINQDCDGQIDEGIACEPVIDEVIGRTIERNGREHAVRVEGGPFLEGGEVQLGGGLELAGLTLSAEGSLQMEIIAGCGTSTGAAALTYWHPWVDAPEGGEPPVDLSDDDGVVIAEGALHVVSGSPVITHVTPDILDRDDGPRFTLELLGCNLPPDGEIFVGSDVCKDIQQPAEGQLSCVLEPTFGATGMAQKDVCFVSTYAELEAPYPTAAVCAHRADCACLQDAIRYVP